MKLAETIIKAAAAVAAIAGIAYLVVKYMDAIKAWLEKICPCCTLEDDFEDGIVEDEEVEAAEEAAEEAPVAEETPVDDSVPVAEEADFEA